MIITEDPPPRLPASRPFVGHAVVELSALKLAQKKCFECKRLFAPLRVKYCLDHDLFHNHLVPAPVSR